MTLQTFSRDVIPIIQLAVTALGLVSLLLLWRQLRITSRWNQINFTHTFLNTELFGKLEDALVDETNALGMNIAAVRPLSEPEVKALLEHPKALRAVKAYLTHLENVCAGIQAGAAEPNISYVCYSVSLLQAWLVFKPFILHIRQAQADDDIYRELSKTADEWHERDEMERRKRERKQGI
jgi:Domain of unknown function (DUF4760)